MHPEETKNLKLNYTVNILDGAFFGFGIGFASFSTVIPLFVATMTDSAILIGLISAVHVMGWQIPQLLTAQHVSRLARYKPMVMWMTIHERIPFIGLALVALFYKQLGAQPAIILTFIMLAWQGIGAGFTANAWQNLMSKVIPGDYLATFFGMQSSAANLLQAGSAAVAGLWIERLPFPNNYVLCFLTAFGMLILSYIAIAFTRESTRENVIKREEQPRLVHAIRDILRRDRNFAWFLAARTMVQFGTMAFSFYTVFAVKNLGAGEYDAGILTSVLFIAQVATNLLLGWVADRWSRIGVLKIGALSILFSALIAHLAPSVGWMYPVMVLSAIANTAFWTISMALVLQFGHEDDRPTYVGMANTFIAPATMIAPLIGGWMADTGGYRSTFLFAAIAGLISLAMLHFLVKEPEKVRKQVTPPQGAAGQEI